ncbi:MAG: DUF411 domain-containing protein [Gammaproteobacteria bacterium]|nr:DUF411 domain-containing protein [Gammaproteobacteria bacterium]
MNRQFVIDRRGFLVASGAMLLAGPAFAARDVIEVFKSSTCDCCTKWIAHLRANGFVVQAHDVDDITVSRARLGVPAALGSCHTGSVGGYLVEGHVPARDIQRLLREHPDAAGLAVPGMARGSPGMEADVSDPYDVLLFQLNGHYTVYQRYGAR